MYRVLIVDDEYYVRVMLKHRICWEDRGFTVVGEAENGEEALLRIRELIPDLVIVDIEMPFIDGLELIDRIHAQYNEQIRVLLLTCHDRFEYAQKALNEGVDGYLLKPVDEEELGNALDKIRRRLDMSREHLMQSLNNVSALSLLREEMVECLHSGDIEQIKSYLTDLMARAADDELDCSYDAVQNIYLGVLSDYCDEEGIEFTRPDTPMTADALISLTARKVHRVAGSRQSRQTELVETVKAFIAEHYRDPELSLSMIARENYVNASYLSRVYNQVTRESITTTIRNVRLSSALQMLKNGAVNIEQLSEAVGFRNAGYFSRCFKEQYGISPSEIQSRK